MDSNVVPGVADPTEAELFPMTRADVLARRQLEREGFSFKLFRTGTVARVRLVSLSDRATMGTLPTALQERLTKIFGKANAETGKARSFKEFLSGAETTLEMADLLCVIGFLEPKLVLTEADLESNPEAWVVTDLHPDERIAFFQVCNDETAAEKLQPFHRKPIGDVLDRQVEPTSIETVRPTSFTPSGV